MSQHQSTSSVPPRFSTGKAVMELLPRCTLFSVSASNSDLPRASSIHERKDSNAPMLARRLEERDRWRMQPTSIERLPPRTAKYSVSLQAYLKTAEPYPTLTMPVPTADSGYSRGWIDGPSVLDKWQQRQVERVRMGRHSTSVVQLGFESRAQNPLIITAFSDGASVDPSAMRQASCWMIKIEDWSQDRRTCDVEIQVCASGCRAVQANSHPRSSDPVLLENEHARSGAGWRIPRVPRGTFFAILGRAMI
ncbi:hypothetical protein BDW22DRAFT_1348423 [Trametopsis cervina]|nr:hypothetical protein BDW22DRAFT_1348423 [Trametopsis cervina]